LDCSPPFCRTPGSAVPKTVENTPVPLLKAPVWTWEVPAYFFVGGAAGTAAAIAAAAGFKADAGAIATHARWIAAAGAVLAPPLLISDLGRPARFLNMLRIFKPQSPMSVGAWTLFVFSAAAVASLVGHDLIGSDIAARAAGGLPWAVTRLADVAGLIAALTGLILATYTGVLIGVTVIPVWTAHVRVLPVLFGLSGLGAAISCLELLGDRTSSLNAMGLVVAVIETGLLLLLERRGDPRREALHRGTAGAMTRSAGVLSGPVAAAIRLVSLWWPPLRLAASVAMIVGSALTRFGWVAAGRASARDLDISLR
jgi:formate-dependent nitrite reductase membrane component NrfD